MADAFEYLCLNVGRLFVHRTNDAILSSGIVQISDAMVLTIWLDALSMPLWQEPCQLSPSNSKVAILSLSSWCSFPPCRRADDFLELVGPPPLLPTLLLLGLLVLSKSIFLQTSSVFSALAVQKNRDGASQSEKTSSKCTQNISRRVAATRRTNPTITPGAVHPNAGLGNLEKEM